MKCQRTHVSAAQLYVLLSSMRVLKSSFEVPVRDIGRIQDVFKVLKCYHSPDVFTSGRASALCIAVMFMNQARCVHLWSHMCTGTLQSVLFALCLYKCSRRYPAGLDDAILRMLSRPAL